LILCATVPKNGPSGITPILAQAFRKKTDVSPKEKMQLRQDAIKLAYKIMELNFSKDFLRSNPDVVKGVAADQLRYRIPFRVMQQQSQAIRNFDATSRLHLLAGTPTLVLHGTEDYVLGYDGARALLRLIPGSVEAKLEAPAFGHYFFKEVDVVKVIDEFLRKEVATKSAVQAKL